MIDPTQNIVNILCRHTSGLRGPVIGSTQLSDLGIDLLDLPMVILDLEDAFQICIRYDDYVHVSTVRELAACVVRHGQKSIREARLLATTARVRRPWTSTGAEQR